MKTEIPTTSPPKPEDAIACADCGAPTRSAWRRGYDRQLREHLICTSCGGVVKILPPRKSSRTQSEFDQLVSESADFTEEVIDRMVHIQRELLAQAWGPEGPLPIHRARAYHAVLLTLLTTGRQDNIDRLAQKLEAETSGQTARFRGWHRAGKRQKWQAVVSAGSEAQALDQLLGIAGGDKVVLPSDRDPNTERRPR